MIPLFEFSIDKKANFIYWAQSLLGKWSWHFEKPNSALFINEAGLFSKTEQEALDKLKIILQGENNQYRWLWQRYNHLPVTKIREKKEYAFIKKALKKKFNLLWNKELPRLNAWKKELGQYNFSKLDKAFQKISIFLGLKKNKKAVLRTRVKLLVSSDFPGGATRPDFNFMILGLSRVPVIKINRVVAIISHEFTHFINTKSGLLASLLRSSTHPSQKLDKGYEWKYLVTETILKSMASHRSNSYIGLLLDFSEEVRRYDENLSHKKPLAEYSYEFLIRIAARRLLPKTINYLNKGKTIDKNFMDLTIKILLDLIKERKHSF